MMSLTTTQREATRQVGLLYLRFGFPDRAATLFAALNILEPREPEHLRALALAQHLAGKPKLAMAALDALALAGAIDAPFHSLRALVLGELGRADESRAAMQAYLEACEPSARPAGEALRSAARGVRP
jgi:Flp pilus assembly protein TadD